ncbi:MAG: phosphotransferase [Clostridia bacterium]|nr:phosphotransferase [Clostridia bacterium]
MKLLDNSDKHLLSLIPQLVLDKLGKAVDSLNFIGGGSFGRVYKAELSDGEAIAVKAYKLQGDQYGEAQQLDILADNTSVKMPEVVFTYEDEDTAILAMTFVEGKNVLEPVFLLRSKVQKKAFAEAVVDGMLQWHSVTNDKFGSLAAPEYESWFDYYKTEKQEPWMAGFRDLSKKGKLSKNRVKLLEEATELFNSLPDEDSEPVLIHGDLNIMNIMADPKTLELIAFIDPNGCMWADREYDLYQFHNMWGDAYGLYETYKEKYPLSPYADFRVAYYGAMHEVSMRLKVGHVIPLWEDLNIRRLKKEMKKLKEMM